MIRSCAHILGLLLISTALWTREARVHRDDYLNETLVYLTLQRSEVETEYWFDHGRHPSGQGAFSRHNAALEWGIGNRWMVDGRVTFISEEQQGTNFGSGRLESRYRFSEEGVLPIDMAASFEVNLERESDGSTIVGIEPRVVLSRDFAEKLNFTVNLSEELPLDSSSAAFLVAFGTRFNWTQLFRVGSEVQYNFANHSGSAIPQVWLALPRDFTIKIGYSIGVDQEPDDFARAALEVEF